MGGRGRDVDGWEMLVHCLYGWERKGRERERGRIGHDKRGEMSEIERDRERKRG